MQLVRLAPIGVLALTMAACGTLRPASVGGGECRVFERPEYAVLGQTGYDQNWIDSNTEAGVAGCGWQRPKRRPHALGRSAGAKHLGSATKKRPGLMGHVRRVVAPKVSAQFSAPAATPTTESPSVPAAPTDPRDPVDELLELEGAPPAKPPRRRCWWC